MNLMKIFKHNQRLVLIDRLGLARFSWLGLFLLVILMVAIQAMFAMPGTSYRGKLSPLSPAEITLRNDLQQDINFLTGNIGPRNYLNYPGLQLAVEFIDRSFTSSDYAVEHQKYQIGDRQYENLIVEIPGNQNNSEIVVVGAHYDSAFNTAGANDNGSGTAGIIELAKLFKDFHPQKTLRLVAFVNEEPPFFWTENMGSLVYAQRCHQRKENIVAMLSLETMGYYTNETNTQKYPTPLNLIYPSQGNFISFVGNLKSRKLVRQVINSFQQQVDFPSEGAAVPNVLPGIGWSDHWSFWQQGYPAIMVTDTAPFRYPHYHTLDDTADKIDYDSLARVVMGMQKVITKLTT